MGSLWSSPEVQDAEAKWSGFLQESWLLKFGVMGEAVLEADLIRRLKLQIIRQPI